MRDGVQNITGRAFAEGLSQSRSVKSEERIDDHRVVHWSRGGPFESRVPPRRKFLAIGSIRGECIEAVHNRENSCADRDFRTFNTRRVAGSIPVFVMVPDDGHNRVWKIDRGEDIRADARMQLHLFEFGSGQLPGLVQDVLGYGKFTHVMEQGRGFDRLQETLIPHTDFMRKARAWPARDEYGRELLGPWHRSPSRGSRLSKDTNDSADRRC